MEPQSLEGNSSTCLRSVIGVILGVLPLGLLIVCSLLLCTPAFFPTLLLTIGVFVLDVGGFLSYWWLGRRSTNTCLVVALYLYFALLFVFGVVLYFGDLTCQLQHAL
jgi:hypothetical protein